MLRVHWMRFLLHNDAHGRVLEPIAPRLSKARANPYEDCRLAVGELRDRAEKGCSRLGGLLLG